MNRPGKAPDGVSRGPLSHPPAAPGRHAWPVRPVLASRTRYRSAKAIFAIAAVLRSAARTLGSAAARLHAWLDARRVAAIAFHDFETMGDRELRDIGLTRVDLHRIAWGASDRFQEPV